MRRLRLRQIHRLQNGIPPLPVASTCIPPLRPDIPSHLGSRPRCSGFSSTARHAAKTKALLKVKDLPQGCVAGEALPELEADDAPRYPVVIQGVRNHMIKFNDCVVLTRVGNFYEVSSSAVLPTLIIYLPRRGLFI